MSSARPSRAHTPQRNAFLLGTCASRSHRNASTTTGARHVAQRDPYSSRIATRCGVPMSALSATRSSAARISSADGAFATTARAHSPSGSRDRATPRRPTRSDASAADAGCPSGSRTMPRSGAYALVKVSATAWGNADPKRWSGRGSDAVSIGVNDRTRSRRLLTRSRVSLQLEEYGPPCVRDDADPLSVLGDDEILDLADWGERVAGAIRRSKREKTIRAIQDDRALPDGHATAVDEGLRPANAAFGGDRGEPLRLHHVERRVAPEFEVARRRRDAHEALRRIGRGEREAECALVGRHGPEGTRPVDREGAPDAGHAQDPGRKAGEPH